MIRSTSTSTNRICLFFCVTLVMLIMDSCRSQPVGQRADTQTGELSIGIEFLKKTSSEHIRVMSYNVGWDSIFPDDDPQNNQWRRDSRGIEFTRILRAVKPERFPAP